MKNAGKIATLGMLVGVVAAMSTTSAFAGGDAVVGKKEFKNCQTCHSLEKGKHKFGPSLYKILGRKVGSEAGFKYSDYYKMAGMKGLVWDEKSLAQYITNPSGFLAIYLDLPEAKPKMMNKVGKPYVRDNIIAFLKTQ